MKTLKTASVIGLILLSPWLLLAGNGTEKINTKKKFSSETARIWESQKTFSLSLLDQMPEDQLESRPNESVRSFAELFKHIAGSSIFLEAIVTGTDVNAAFAKMGEIEKTHMSKKEVAKLLDENLQRSAELIRGMSEKDLNKTFTFSFLPDAPVKTYREIIVAMGSHIVHHRGQATTYLRMNNIVPSPYQNWW